MEREQQRLIFVIVLVLITWQVGYLSYVQMAGARLGPITIPMNLPQPIDRQIASPQFLVDINQADWIEIACLPGIGEVYAREIAQYREQFGPFRSPEQLTVINGIGPRLLEQIRPFIKIGDVAERDESP